MEKNNGLLVESVARELDKLGIQILVPPQLPKIEIFDSIVKYICVMPESEHFGSLEQLKHMLESGVSTAHLLKIVENTLQRGGQIKFENPKQ